MKNPMWIVCYTIYCRENDLYEDHFEVIEDKAEAQNRYRALLKLKDLYCAAISRVVEATEPHWEDQDNEL